MGRPRKTATTTATSDTPADDLPFGTGGALGASSTPLFAGSSAQQDGRIPSQTAVYRFEPESNDFAFMGLLGANADEIQVQAVFGGGKYRFQLRAEDGSVVANSKPVVLWGARKYPDADTGQMTGPAASQFLEGAPSAGAETNEGGPAYREVLAMQKTMMAEQRALSAQALAEMREAAKAEREERRQEIELQMQMLEARADRERKDLEAKSERERKAAEEKHARDLERERDRRAAETQQAREFMGALQAMQKESTAVMVAAMNRDTASGKTEDLLKLMVAMKELSSAPEVDPTVEVTKQISSAVTGLASIAQNEMASRRAASPGQVVVHAKPTTGGAAAARAAQQAARAAAPAAAKAAPPAPELPAGDVMGVLDSLSQKLTAAGHDPLEILKKLDAGELALGDAKTLEGINSGKLGVFEVDEHGEPLLDEDEEGGQTPGNGAATPAHGAHGGSPQPAGAGAATVGADH
jgi:hypothetical protein